jgi:hypothetical protein
MPCKVRKSSCKHGTPSHQESPAEEQAVAKAMAEEAQVEHPSMLCNPSLSLSPHW